MACGAVLAAVEGRLSCALGAQAVVSFPAAIARKGTLCPAGRAAGPATAGPAALHRNLLRRDPDNGARDHDDAAHHAEVVTMAGTSPEAAGEIASVPVALAASRIEAELIVGMLRSNGVTAVLSADDAGGQEPPLQLQGVRVLVTPSDQAIARQLLAAADDSPA